MNIVYLCNYNAQYAGNFIPCLVDIASRVTEEGGSATFVLPLGASNKAWIADLSNFSVTFIDYRHIISSFKSMYEILRKAGDDCIVHTHFLDPIPLLITRLLCKKILVHYHMSPYVSDDSRPSVGRLLKDGLKARFYHQVYKSVNVVGVSSEVAKGLRDKYGLSNVVCVTNAIDVGHLLPPKRYETLTPSDRPYHTLLFGTHFERKGGDLACRAVKELNDGGLSVELTIPTHDVQETRALVRACLSTPDVPSFIRVVKVKENVRELFDWADCFLSPSRSEAFGYAVVEAAYYGDQVIASEVPGQRVLKDIPGIKWIATNDCRQLAHAISELMDNPDSYSLVLNRRSYIENNYSINTWVDKIYGIYQSLDS